VLTRRRVLVAGLIGAALVAFLPSIFSGFLADDYMLLRTLRRIGSVGEAFRKNDLGEAGEAGHFYRPIWVLWNAGLKELFGARAFPFHLASLVLYAVISLEVWVLARRLVGETRAWIAAFAFALYPRHGESVSWISGSTDLTAVTLGLGALLCATASWRLPVRLAAAVSLTALAALSKEIAYVLPLLAALIPLAFPEQRRGRWWVIPGAMAIVVVVVGIVRLAIVGGVAGYTAYPWTVERMAAALASYGLAAVTPPDLDVLRHEVLLVFPALLAALVIARLWVLVRRGQREAVRIAAFGIAWFLLTLLPTLNLAVDVSTANGERLMFLGSVGLAIAFAALVDGVAPRQLRTGLLGAAAVAGLALSLLSASNWIAAERISSRVIDSAARLAPPGGELVLLSSPESFRTAHIFPGNFDAALEWKGRRDVAASFCAPVIVRDENRGVVSFEQINATEYRGKTSWDAPFDFPVLRKPSPLSPDCSYARAASGPPGLGLVVIVRPVPSRQPAVLAYFDGYSLRRCC
jgi:hypothetical protein